jgi:hypothetical protein
MRAFYLISKRFLVSFDAEKPGNSNGGNQDLVPKNIDLLGIAKENPVLFPLVSTILGFLANQEQGWLGGLLLGGFGQYAISQNWLDKLPNLQQFAGGGNSGGGSETVSTNTNTPTIPDGKYKKNITEEQKNKLTNLIKSGKIKLDSFLKGQDDAITQAEDLKLDKFLSGYMHPNSLDVILKLGESPKFKQIVIGSAYRRPAKDDYHYHANGVAIDITELTTTDNKSYTHMQAYQGNVGAQNAFSDLALELYNTKKVYRILTAEPYADILRKKYPGKMSATDKGSINNIRIGTTPKAPDNPTSQHQDHFHIDVVG